MGSDPNELLDRIVSRWCERRELHSLAALLPAWLANNGLTDGWGELRSAVQYAIANGRDRLPADELETLRDVERAIDQALASR